MSRSYKHTPIIQDQNNKHFGKKYANKVVRQHNKKEIYKAIQSDFEINDFINSGKSYKQLYETYNVCDFKFYKTKENAVCQYESYLKTVCNGGAWSHYVKSILEKYLTLEDYLLLSWAKDYYRK